MIHARNDYNRIQDPALSDPSLLSPGSSPIGADEPVFLIRAKDRCAVPTLLAWAEELMRLDYDNPKSREVATHVRAWACRIEQWQLANEWKVPDTPSDQLAAV